MAKRGALVDIDLQQVERLASLQCTMEEIAGFFGVSRRTLERRQKNRKFVDAIERGKAKGRISLRRTQFKIAEGGSAAMAIFMGKQYLGQAEQQSDIDLRASIQLVLPPIAQKQEGDVIDLAPDRRFLTPPKPDAISAPHEIAVEYSPRNRLIASSDSAAE